MKVFVYGTLKRGYGNHRLLETKDFLGEAVTVDKFHMIAGGFPVVFLTNDGHPLRGEVYDIGEDTECLARLDALEGEGSMYHRQEVTVDDGHDRYVCNMYIGGTDFWRSALERPTYGKKSFVTDAGELEWGR